MLLTPGTRFGPYEMTAPLGAGGVGDLFGAPDTSRVVNSWKDHTR